MSSSDYEKVFQSYELTLAPLLEAELIDMMPALGQAGFFESDPTLRAKLLREDLPRSIRVQHLFLKMQMSGETGYGRMLRAMEQSKNDRLTEMAASIKISLQTTFPISQQVVPYSKDESGDVSITTSMPVYPATGSSHKVSVPRLNMAELEQSSLIASVESSKEGCTPRWPSAPKICHSTRRECCNYATDFQCFIESLRNACGDFRPVREETTDPSSRHREGLFHFWKLFSQGTSPLNTHPGPICAQGILASKVRGEVYTILYRRRRVDSKAAEDLVEWCLQLNIPADLKMVVANAGLSCRYDSEKVLPLLHGVLEQAENGECDNGDIAVSTLRAHIACVYCHKGDLKMARSVLTPGLQCAQMISDPAVIEAAWVHGWLLLLEGQQGEEVFSPALEKGIDDVYSQTLERLQNGEQWFRDLNEDFKLGKADIHLRIAQKHIDMGDRCDSDVVYQLLQRARDSLVSIDMGILKVSHGNEPFSEAFRNHLWFMYHHLQGNHIEANNYLKPAFDNWIAGKGYKFAREIAELANNSDLLQQLMALGV